MIQEITGEVLASIKNPAFREYAQMYADIERDFRETVATMGLDFAPQSDEVISGELAKRVDALAQRGARVENDRKSISVNWISPACLTCRKGVGTETFLTSTQCPRNCYFCFNPNQADYEYYLSHTHDVVGELQQRYDAGVRYRDLALTGGEPLLHPDLAIGFFERARQLAPDAYTRLYTSGSGLSDDVLDRLQAAGLSEIRFSVKMEDPPTAIEATLDKMRACVGRIPAVMVEMPVMPDQVEQMKRLLVRLDELGVQGINLLELCFPLNNGDEFARRGYRLKARPYRVLYNYLYAGGLPIHGSEPACIELLEFALGQCLKLGVHYCSLENKFTGEVYQQNTYIKMARPYHMKSERDHFLKSAKVFGADVQTVESMLRASGEKRLERNDDYGYLEFSLDVLPTLGWALPNLEVAVCYSLADQNEQGPVLRELAVFKTTAAAFDPASDI